MNGSLSITAEITPNPNTLKFVVNRTFLDSGGMDYPDPERAKESPLASHLFGIPQVTGVFIGTNFITVTKSPEADWNELITPVVNGLREVLSTQDLVFRKPEAAGTPEEIKDPTELRIRQILEQEIQPAVAMDGGDVMFISYKDGVLTLRLRGSCSACPSAVMTLRMGIENRLRAEIPELKEIVQIG